MRPRTAVFSGATRRPVLLVAGFLYLASLVLGQAHVAIELHTICVEHGELVEVSSAGGDALGTCGSAATSGEREHAFAPCTETGEPEHGHDHCPIAWLSRERHVGSSAPAPLPVDVAATPRALAPSAALAAPSAIPLYRLAPKHSPPAV